MQSSSKWRPDEWRHQREGRAVAEVEMRVYSLPVSMGSRGGWPGHGATARPAAVSQRISITFFMYLWRTLRTLPNKPLFQNVYALSHYVPVQRAVERRKPVPGYNVNIISQHWFSSLNSPWYRLYRPKRPKKA